MFKITLIIKYCCEDTRCSYRSTYRLCGPECYTLRTV